MAAPANRPRPHCYIREHMRRHEDRSAAPAQIRQELIEGFLHEWIKPFGRLVENQQQRISLKRLN